MNEAKAPLSLRSFAGIAGYVGKQDVDASRTLAVACLITAGTVSAADAQSASSALPPVTVDAPVARPRPAVILKATPTHVRARTALRRQVRQRVAAPRVSVPSHAAPTTAPPSLPILAQGGARDGDPYANPAAPYMAQRLSSPKYTEPLLNTPKTVTVLTKEIIEDKNATSLKDLARTTAGVTMGTGEGGNAFGDRFFIRGFDARNDIFVDGVRDPGVSIRENFFTDQVEILRGPGSSLAGRGTTGGAINIVTKQATDQNFKTVQTTFGTDATKRVTVDVNQVINPTLSVRAGGLFQDANVAGRDVVTDNRWGAFAAVKWTPVENATFKMSYDHTDLSGIPDFGVPYYRPNPATNAGGPFPDFGVNRNNFYGFANRDFYVATQDIGTISGEIKLNDWATVSNKFRLEHSLNNYIGTIPESPIFPNPNPSSWTFTANPQSRYQTTDVIANQTDVTLKYDTGPIKNTTVAGIEISRERVSINSYTGLTSEAYGNTFNGSGSVAGVYVFNPQYTYIPFPNFNPALSTNPTVVPIDTKSVYIIQTANYNDLIILNGGLRYDDYNVSATNNNGSQSVQSGLVNYNAGITYKPLPNASIYAAYATSSDPVGSELDATGAAYGGLPAFTPGNPNQVFGPEKNQGVEFGTKWELFDKRLLATAALFQTEKENARETATINSVANTVIAGAAYRIRGIDLEVGGKITDDWSVFGGLVLMQSVVQKSYVSSNVGLPLANIAHQSFNLLTKYQITPKIELGGQATYVSQMFGGTLAANSGTILPAHWRFDAFTEYKVTENLTAKLSVNNIFNTLYYDAFYRSAAPFVLEAPGRSAYLTVTAKF